MLKKLVQETLLYKLVQKVDLKKLACLTCFLVQFFFIAQVSCTE